MNKELIMNNWKELARNKTNTAARHLEYIILRAMASKSDSVEVAKHLFHKAFSPVTNINKLASGQQPFGGANVWLNAKEPLGIKLSDEDSKEFQRIRNELRPSKLIRHYSYFFTRQDIFPEYQLVQTAHAALELGNRLTSEQVKNLHFTCVGVADLNELHEVQNVLDSLGHEYVIFREPDIGNEITSIGVYPIAEHKRGVLRSYPLLRFETGVPLWTAKNIGE